VVVVLGIQANLLELVAAEVAEVEEPLVRGLEALVLLAPLLVLQTQAVGVAGLMLEILVGVALVWSSFVILHTWLLRHQQQVHLKLMSQAFGVFTDS